MTENPLFQSPNGQPPSEAQRALERETHLPMTGWQQEVARGLEFGLEAAESIRDRSIPTFSRGELPGLSTLQWGFGGLNFRPRRACLWAIDSKPREARCRQISTYAQKPHCRHENATGRILELLSELHSRVM